MGSKWLRAPSVQNTHAWFWKTVSVSPIYIKVNSVWSLLFSPEHNADLLHSPPITCLRRFNIQQTVYPNLIKKLVYYPDRLNFLKRFTCHNRLIEPAVDLTALTHHRAL